MAGTIKIFGEELSKSDNNTNDIKIINMKSEDYENQKEVLLTVSYNFMGRVSVLAFRMLAIILGISLMYINSMFAQLSGVLILLYGLISLFPNMLFSHMLFYNNIVEIEWNLFGYKIRKKENYKDLVAIKHNGIFGGSITFGNRKNRLDIIYFGIDLLPLSKSVVKNIKKILIEKNVIGGDEYVWID